MLETITSIVNAVRQLRRRSGIARQFAKQGFSEIDCPPIEELLPLRFPEIVNNQNVCMFAKDDTRMLVVPTSLLPRTRVPHRGRTFVMLCTTLEVSPLVAGISAALRHPAELFSIVDQLEMDSYPTLSPLPSAMLFAADDYSAEKLMEVLSADTRTGSVVLHGGRLLAQVSA